MRKILNNIMKGLLTAFVVIVIGGFISLNIGMSSDTSMMLISSSVINSIKTDASSLVNEEKVVENASVKEEIEDNLEEVVEQVSEEVKEEVKEEIKEVKEETQVAPPVVSTPQPEVVKEPETNNASVSEPPVANSNYNPNTEVASTTLDTYYGIITAYGPDCYGCVSGETASGYNVLNGNIYYNDPTYGTIRIVAADRSLPFGTIVKISGLTMYSEPVIAIVLDRGGAIGFNKSVYFDLLFTSEYSSEVYNFGKQYATFEILRRGY